MDVKLRHAGSSDVLTVPSAVKESSTVSTKFTRDAVGRLCTFPSSGTRFLNKIFVELHLDKGDRTGFIDGAVTDDELKQ